MSALDPWLRLVPHLDPARPALALLGGLLLITFVGGAAKGLVGFGGALVMAPLFGLLIPAADVSVLIVMVHCVTSFQGARSWAPQVNWPQVIPLAAVTVACAALCSGLTTHSNGPLIRHIVALCVIGATLLHMRGWRWRHTGGWAATTLAGAIAGFLTAIAGLGGPPAVYYFNGVTDGHRLRANLLAYFALVYTGFSSFLLIGGKVHLPQLAAVAVLVPLFALGVFLGERNGRRLSKTVFDRLVCALLLASGMTALLA